MISTIIPQATRGFTLSNLLLLLLLLACSPFFHPDPVFCEDTSTSNTSPSGSPSSPSPSKTTPSKPSSTPDVKSLGATWKLTKPLNLSSQHFPLLDVSFPAVNSALFGSGFSLLFNLNNLRFSLSSYLDVSQVSTALAHLNKSPLSANQVVIGHNDVVAVLSSNYSKSGAEQSCVTLGGRLFAPESDEHVTFLRKHADGPIWVQIEGLSPSAPNVAVYEGRRNIPSRLMGSPVAADFSHGSEDGLSGSCVLFAPSNMTFFGTNCNGEFATVCEFDNADYINYDAKVPLVKTILADLDQLKTWFHLIDGTSILNNPDRPSSSTCSSSFEIFQHTYPPVPTSSFPTALYLIERFLQKFDWIQKFLVILKWMETSSIPTLLGINLTSTEDNNLCVSWNNPLTKKWQPWSSFYSFSITDVCLASATVMVALLTCLHVCRSYKKNQPVPNFDTPGPALDNYENAREMQPLQADDRHVNFNDNVDAQSVASSVGPEDRYR